MGVRGELFSTKVITEKRTYFFNVKENRVGDVFLNIVESKKGEEAEFERHQIMVYQEELEAFMREISKAAAVIQKKREVGPAPRPARPRPPRPEGERPQAKPGRGGDRPELVPTYGMDGKWEGPEAMKAKGGKVARISRKQIEARAAENAAQAGAEPEAAAEPAKKPRARKPSAE